MWLVEGPFYCCVGQKISYLVSVDVAVTHGSLKSFICSRVTVREFLKSSAIGWIFAGWVTRERASRGALHEFNLEVHLGAFLSKPYFQPPADLCGRSMDGLGTSKQFQLELFSQCFCPIDEGGVCLHRFFLYRRWCWRRAAPVFKFE